MWSTDGINWTAAAAPENNRWRSVKYGGDKFIAVSDSGTNRLMYSYDGISWDGDLTKLILTNDKVFDSSNGIEMSTVDQVLTAGMVVEGESDSTVLTPAFSTTIYQGNDGTQTINTGIDNRSESLVWIKSRNDVGGGGNYHFLVDTIRGGDKFLMSNIDQGSTGSGTPIITSFNNNGYTLSTGSGVQNQSSSNYVAWNFRAAPNFFDIVTYSGDGSTNQEFSHSLGSMPGMVMIKNLSRNSGWFVWVDDSITTLEGELNTNGDFGYNVIGTVTDTKVQTLYTNQNSTNRTGDDFIAYIFAKDTPGLIKCGSYTGTGSGFNTTDVGFKVEWLMVKNKTGSGSWTIFDRARGYNKPGLYADTTGPEEQLYFEWTDTGFQMNVNNSNVNEQNSTYVYIAIAENAMAGDFAPTGVLAEDANPSDPSITLTNVTGIWSGGETAVGQTQLTKYAPGPDDITFTSQNAGTTPFNGTDATLAFRRWTLESRASAGDPWVVVDTYEDYDIVASQDGATPWSSNKPALAPNTMYRVKVAYISTNADPVESVYNTFTTGSN